MADLDCYFFIDYDLPEEEQSIEILCMECHDKEMPDEGWFYRGSRDGYGPYDYKCSICGKFVHRACEKDDEKETEAPGEDPRG